MLAFAIHLLSSADIMHGSEYNIMLDQTRSFMYQELTKLLLRATGGLHSKQSEPSVRSANRTTRNLHEIVTASKLKAPTTKSNLYSAIKNTKSNPIYIYIQSCESCLDGFDAASGSDLSLRVSGEPRRAHACSACASL